MLSATRLSVLRALPLAGLLAAVALAGPAAAQQAESPYGEMRSGPLAALKAAPSEFYVHSVPEGWSWQEVDSNPPVHAITFLPEGQPRRGWTDALVLTLYAGRAVPPEGLLVRAERELATKCRDLRRSGTEVGRIEEGGWAEGWQLLACRQTLNGGGGEVHVLHAVQGESASYLARRVWRTPPIGAEFPVGQSEVEVAREILAQGTPCLQDAERPDRRCPSWSAMGLGSIGEEQPYGVFELRGN
jgi:hypothetical protein